MGGPVFPVWNDPFTIFDFSAGNEITLRQTQAGQLLVPATINGQDVGYWMLDTGASINVMSESVQRCLGLEKLGEANATVIGGLAGAKFVMVNSFTAGPMTMHNQTFAVIDSNYGQVVGLEVAGLLGYEFLMRVVFEVQNYGDDVSGINKRRGFIYNPKIPIDWQGLSEVDLKFVSNNPYIEATVQGDCECPHLGI